jgi:hypothetical protein
VRALPFIAAILLAAALPAQDGATVEGAVANSLTGAGVAGVTVRLWTQKGTHYETTTDAAGAYRITGMSPGDYDSLFEKTGFGEIESDSNAPFTVPRRLHVAPAKDSFRLDHQLAPLATVRGRVINADGTPAAHVEVTITIGPDGFTTTNDQGEFVIDKLRPGSYSIRADPPKPDQAKTAKPVLRDGERIETVPTFYPSVTDKTSAPLVTVRAGSDQAGFDIRMQAVPVYRVSGIVIDDSGKPVSGAYVSLSTSSEDSYLSGQMGLGYPQGARYLLTGRWPGEEGGGVSTKADGRFLFSSVRSGDWRAAASSDRGRDPVTHGDIEWSGEAGALVSRHDLDDIEIRVAPPFTRDGVVDWGDLPVHPAARQAYVWLISSDTGRPAMALASMGGPLHFENIAAGRYRIFPLPVLGSAYYPAAVLLADRDVTGQEVVLNATSPPIRLVMKANPGTVRGLVENGAGSTVLISRQTSRDLDPLLSVPASPDGAFQIPGLPPGDYSIVAFDRVSTGQNSSARLSTILAPASRVHVDEGATATVQLQVNRWPQ